MSDKQGILIFNLPEEQNAFELAVKATAYGLAWNHMHENIRQILKYNDPPKDVAETLEMVRAWMVNLEDEYELVRPI